MSEIQKATLKRRAGVLIPFMIMPDGKEIDVGPGDIVNDPAAVAVKFEKWLDAWINEVAKDTEPMTMEDLAEVDYRGRVDLGPLGVFGMITFGSLFAGIGGLDLGLERAGMQCKWQVEIDDYSTKVLERHWPHVRRWRDINTFPPNDSDANCNKHDTVQVEAIYEEEQESFRIDEGWRVDLICGGFPCQDISYAGRGAGLEGARSGLFFEALRVVRQLRPRFVLLENVAALLTRGLDRVHGELAEIGYCSESHCLPAAAFGAPHIRDRVFIIGTDTSRTASNTNGKRPKRGENKTNRKLPMSSSFRNEVADTNCTRPQISRNAGTPGESTSGILTGTTPDRSGWWSVEPDVGRVANGVPSRVDRLRGLGNAVVPQVAEWIGPRIVEETVRCARARWIVFQAKEQLAEIDYEGTFEP